MLISLGLFLFFIFLFFWNIFRIKIIQYNIEKIKILLTSIYISCIIKKVQTSRGGAVGSSLGS